MLIYEHEAKDIFRQYGIPVPNGVVCEDMEDVSLALANFASGAMLKAQVLTGGRGKRGGIIGVGGLSDGLEKAKDLFAREIRGLPVGKILVEEKIEIEEEYYLGITVDYETAEHLIIFKKSGGINVEESQGVTGELRIKPGDPLYNFQLYQLLHEAELAVNNEQKQELIGIIRRLYAIHLEYNALIVEINPLVLTRSGDILAIDARLNFDGNVVARSERLKKYWEQQKHHNDENELRSYGIDYVSLEGNVALVSIGAGLTMAAMDQIKRAGGEPACFMDLSKSIKKETFVKALQVVSSKEGVKSICLNFFGGLTHIDMVAKNIVEAIKELPQLDLPIAIRLEGTNAELGREIIKQNGLPLYHSLLEVAEKAVQFGGRD